MSPSFPLPPTASGAVTQPPVPLSGSDGCRSVLYVADSTNGTHALLGQTEFLLVGHHDYHVVVGSFSDYGGVCAGRVAEDSTCPDIFFYAVHLGAQRQGAQGIGVTF